MGLDMYLNGNIFFWDSDEDRIKVDGKPVKEMSIELGYWRKYPDLHGFIVREFANGVDECQDIELGEDDCEKIAKAIEDDDLPETQGFLFGTSDWHKDEKAQNAKVFRDAVKWTNGKDDGKVLTFKSALDKIDLNLEHSRVSRYIVYRASW